MTSEELANLATPINADSKPKISGLDKGIAGCNSASTSFVDEEPTPIIARKLVELKIDRDFDSYCESDQEYLLSAIRQLLNIKSDLVVTKVRCGSVIITISIEAEAANTLVKLINNGTLFECGIISANLIPNKCTDKFFVKLKKSVLREQCSNIHATNQGENIILTKQGKYKISSENDGNSYTSKLTEQDIAALLERTKLLVDIAPVKSTGVVKWFNNAKGFGFIEQEGGEDVFVHFSKTRGAKFMSLSEGDWVEFEVVQGPKGAEASNLTIKNKNH